MLNLGKHSRAGMIPALMVVCLLVMAGPCMAGNLLSNGDFVHGDKAWTAWPQDEQVLKIDTHGGRTGEAAALLHPAASKNSATIYQYADLKGLHAYEMDFWYRPASRQSATAGQLKLEINFNAKGGGNGSAGHWNTSIPLGSADGQWQHHRQIFAAPPDAVAAQVALTLENDKEGVWLDDVRLTDQTEAVIYPADYPPKIDGRLDDPAWKRATPLEGFWPNDNTAGEASLLTTAWMTYDKENLYIAIVNDEPHMEGLRAKITQRDGAVWSDDCDEVFIVPPDANGVHLAVNSLNTQADLAMVRDSAGDIQQNLGWNGQWQSAVAKGDKEWTVEIKIPLATLKTHIKPGADWKIDLCRERYAEMPQATHWNRASGEFGAVDKFADLTFGDKDARLTRFVEDVSQNPLAIERPDAQFQSLLSDQPGHYDVSDWSTNVYLKDYPASVQKKYTAQTWRSHVETLLDHFGEAGMSGPVFPWASERLGWEMLERLNAKYGMTYDLFIDNSALSQAAREHGAKWFYPASEAHERQVAIIDPTLIAAIEQSNEAYVKSDPRILKLMHFVIGIDEPSNIIFEAFSPTRRPDMKSDLAKVDEEIREHFGHGKYGLFDQYASEDAATPFKRIAFLKWWNHHLADAIGQLQAFFRTVTPGKPFVGFDINTTNSMNPGDVTLLSPHTDWISTDPYPTATLAKYGQARALYHTGFSTKLLTDMGGKPLRAICQCFVYYGGSPTPADIREWASQALKNGATSLAWYTSGPAQVTVPKAFDEMIRVNGVVHRMNKLPLPTRTHTAIFFSQVDRWARDDKPMDAAYSLYALLGERLGSWFRFVSDTQLAQNPAALDSYTLIYVPGLTYVDRTVAERLVDRAKAGATLVIFDPNALTWATDGTHLNDLRQAAGGFALGAPRHDNLLLSSGDADIGKLKAGAPLPLTPQANGENIGRIEAYTLNHMPPGAKVVATYADGTPAAYRLALGKGSVIWFAAQPFGNADLVLKDNNWIPWLGGMAAQVGEKTDLPSWHFLIPAGKGQ